MLIELGAEIDARDNLGRTPLSLATISGYEAVARLLIELGAEVNFKDHIGGTPLLYAAYGGMEAVVRLLFEQNDIDIESKDLFGRTAFDHAVKRVSQGCGEKSMVKLLRREKLRRKNLLKG